VWCYETKQKYNRQNKKWPNLDWHSLGSMGDFSTKCLCSKNRSSTRTTQSSEPRHLLWQRPLYPDLTRYGQLSFSYSHWTTSLQACKHQIFAPFCSMGPGI